MGAFIDDGAHAHPKREEGDVSADGLLFRCLSYAADNRTNGWVPATWMEKQVDSRRRRKVIQTALSARLIERFPAGEVRRFVGPVKPGLRAGVISVTVGPHQQDGFVIHDYLHCNRADVELAERREMERVRKALWRAEKREHVTQPSVSHNDVSHGTVSDVSHRTSRVCPGSGSDIHVVDLSDNGEQQDLPAIVDEIFTVLSRCRRFELNEVADPDRIANALARFPSAPDPLDAAALAAEWGDGAKWRIDDAVVTLGIALRKQVEKHAPKRTDRQAQDDADFEAIKRHAARASR